MSDFGTFDIYFPGPKIGFSFIFSYAKVGVRLELRKYTIRQIWLKLMLLLQSPKEASQMFANKTVKLFKFQFKDKLIKSLPLSDHQILMLLTKKSHFSTL